MFNGFKHDNSALLKVNGKTVDSLNDLQMPHVGVTWNLDCPEFVPNLSTGSTSLNACNTEIYSNTFRNASCEVEYTLEIQLMKDCLAQMNLDFEESAHYAEELTIAFQSQLPSVAAVSQLVDALLEMVFTSPSCVPAAIKLATCLAQRISAQNRTELLQEGQINLIDQFPFFSQLMKGLNRHFFKFKALVAGGNASSVSGNALLRFISGLYLQCCSPLQPGTRFPDLASWFLQLVLSLLTLHGDREVHETIAHALNSCYISLEKDAYSLSNNVVGSSNQVNTHCVDIKLLDRIYEELRQAVAHGRCGSVDSALAIVRLLEKRASGASDANSCHSFGQSTTKNHCGLDMTDEMLEDFESFLHMSGQLGSCGDICN